MTVVLISLSDFVFFFEILERSKGAKFIIKCIRNDFKFNKDIKN